MTLTKHTKAILAALGVYFIWGFTFLASSVAQRSASPMVLLMYRFDIASILLLLPVLVGRKSIRLKGKKLLPLLMMGVCEPVIYFIGEQYGIKYTNSSFAGICISVIPLVTMFMAAVFLKEKPQPIQWLFSIVSIGGVIAISIFTSEAGGSITAKGVLWLVLAIVTAAAYVILNRVSSSGSFTVFERTVIIQIEGAVFFTVSALFENINDLRSLIVPCTQPSFFVAVLYLALFASVIGYTLQNYALDNAPVANITTLNALVTVISVIAGVVILHEPFSIKAAVAMVVVLAGIWGVQRFTPEQLKKT